MPPNTIDITPWKREGAAHGARAMLVVWDTLPRPWEPYPVYVLPGEHLAARAAFHSPRVSAAT